MSSFSKNSQKLLVSFLIKTLSILENPLYQPIIGWDPTGKMIEIRNEMEFEETILAQQFKHKNIKSFIRQLNMYGFRKVKKGIAKNSFYHPCFNKHSRDEMKFIKRRKNCRLMPVSDENIPPEDSKKYPLSSTMGGSSDTLNTTKQFQERRETLNSPQIQSVEEILIQEPDPQFYDPNPWNYLSEDIFPDSNQYPFPLPSEKQLQL